MHVSTNASASKRIVPNSHGWSKILGAARSSCFPFRELIQALDCSPLGIVICDRRLRFTRVNRRLAEINRIPIEEHPGRFVYDLVGSLGPTICNRLTQVFSTARSLHNTELRGRLGANPEPAHWVESVFPIPDSRNRVKHVGVFVLPLDGFRLGTAKPADPITSNLERPPTVEQRRRPMLSPRQIDVLRLLADGRSTKEAAATLGISVRTVETYREKLMRRIGAHSVADLVHYSIRHQLVSLH
jgi:DNA-binding CsgD family transcriptional regulator